MNWKKNADLMEGLVHRAYNDPELMSLMPFDEWNAMLQTAEALKELIDGKAVKSLNGQLVIYNYDWYMKHKWEWPKDE